MARAVKAIIEISGRVAGSLPASMRQLNSEIGKLTTAQQKDAVASRQLREERATLRRGSQEYAAVSGRLAAVQGRIDYRTNRIAELGAAQRGATRDTGRLSGRMQGLGNTLGAVTPRVGGLAGSLTGLLGRLGPAGIGLGLLAGGALALGAALNSAGKEAKALLQDAAITGVDVEQYQRAAGIFDRVTESTAEARREVSALARRINDTRLAVGGGIGVSVDETLLTALSAGGGPRLREFLELDINQQTLALLESLANVAGRRPEFAESLARQFGGNFQELFIRLQSGDLTREQIEGDIARQIVIDEESLRTRAAIAENIEGVHDILERIRNGFFGAVIPALGHLLSGIDKLAGPGSQIPDDFEQALKNYGAEERARAASERERRQGEQNFQGQAGVNSLEGAAGSPGAALPAPPARSRTEQAVDAFVALPEPPELLPVVVSLIRRAADAADAVNRGDRSLNPFDAVDPDDRVLGAVKAAVTSVGSVLGSLNPFASDKGPAPTPRRFGGRVQSGEATLVGEDGPEVARFPGGTEILPAPVEDDRVLGRLPPPPQERPAVQPVAGATPAPVEDDRVLGRLPPPPQERPAVQPVAGATPAPVEDDRVLGRLPPPPQERPAVQPVAGATPASVEVSVAAARAAGGCPGHPHQPRLPHHGDHRHRARPGGGRTAQRRTEPGPGRRLMHTFMSLADGSDGRYDFVYPVWDIRSVISVDRGRVRNRKQGRDRVVVLSQGNRGTEIRMTLRYRHDLADSPAGTAYDVVYRDLPQWEDTLIRLQLGEDDFGNGWVMDYTWTIPEGHAAFPEDLSRPVARGGIVPMALDIDVTLFNPDAEYTSRIPHGSAPRVDFFGPFSL